ncbi:hypothetical protein BH18VER1_BH18VER1_22140 [soil metagenome]
MNLPVVHCCEAPGPASLWHRAKTYEMKALQRMELLPYGQVVAVRFNYRHRKIGI